jgi:hypothetical protein
MTIENMIANRAEQFPALYDLNLTEAEFGALRNQGFVSEEPRNGQLYYKLRFRCNRRQRVRVIGFDPARAQAVASELQVLQHDVHVRRRFAASGSQLRRHLRDAKSRLEPLLWEHGFHYHGREIRKRHPVTSTV